jgi:hypothetical protein
MPIPLAFGAGHSKHSMLDVISTGKRAKDTSTTLGH